ncbi:MAG TPA: hypothetical protein VFF63_00430 [Candidatus Babeliales bacterium]|nr:hypothetical protein [Candidatus Babeliales bacterium]
MSATISVGGEELSFELDFGTWRWAGPRDLPEGYFPLAAQIEGKRYELYSDGTFAEVEL